MSKVVVITGAAQGIGKELALIYAKETKTQVVALDINQEALEILKEQEDSIYIFQVDVSNEADLEKVGLQILEKIGKPTIWINNAGLAKTSAFEKMSSADFKKVMDVNFNGIVYGTRVALSLMQKPRRGVIVNMASVNGKVPAPYLSAYGASKHAVVGFTKALQEEHQLSHHPVKIILVTPGFVETAILDHNPEFQLPEWFDTLIESAQAVARQIVKGIEKMQPEIRPTLNGKLMLAMHRIAPELTLKSSRLLVAKSWKELLGLNPIKK